MGSLEYYSDYAHKKISEGYIPGGIKALKEQYPEAYVTMEEKLEKNFTKEGVDYYCKNFINGLKAVNHWRGE